MSQLRRILLADETKSADRQLVGPRDTVGLAGPQVLLSAAADAVRAVWHQRRMNGDFTAVSEGRYLRQLDAFLKFSAAHGAQSVADVSAAICAAWVAAPVSAASPGSRARAGQAAASATRRGRQGVLKQILEVWVRAGWTGWDLMPTEVISKKPVDPPAL